MRLASDSLETQVKGLVQLIDRFGISDAYTIDVCAKELTEEVGTLTKATAAHGAKRMEGGPPEEYDESERLAVQQSGTVQYRSRHNKMTNAVATMFSALKPEQGRLSNSRYDVLLRDYDGAGRDLLIEAKPDPGKGSLRIALGQLYDYRRFLSNSAGTDLAVLTIGKPDASYMDLLLIDRGITVLWFEGESCQALNGDGNAWKPLVSALHDAQAAPAIIKVDGTECMTHTILQGTRAKVKGESVVLTMMAVDENGVPLKPTTSKD